MANMLAIIEFLLFDCVPYDLSLPPLPDSLLAPGKVTILLSLLQAISAIRFVFANKMTEDEKNSENLLSCA